MYLFLLFWGKIFLKLNLEWYRQKLLAASLIFTEELLLSALPSSVVSNNDPLSLSYPSEINVLLVHPQNVRFQNVRFQKVRFQNVWHGRFTKRQVYKTSGLQNVRFTKRQVFKTSGCKKTSINILYLWLLVVGGNPQVMLQPCLQAKWWLCFIFYFWGFFVSYHHNG